MKREEKWARYLHALIYIGVSCGLALIFGLLFGGFSHLLEGGGNFAEDSFKFTEIFFIWFFAFPLVSAALLFLTNLPEDYAFGCGAAMYYGTIFIAGLGRKWYHIGMYDALIIGAFIMTLCCSVVWFGYFKPQIVAQQRHEEKYRDDDPE